MINLKNNNESIKEFNVILNDKSQLYNQFNDSQLSDELSHYIYNQFRGVPLKSNIILNIILKFEMNDDEKNKLVDEIRENYGIDIKENLLKLKIEKIKQIIFILMGIFLLIFANLFNTIHITLASQVFTIFGWVIIYEFVYSFVFNNISTHLENKRYQKLIDAKIHFSKYENINKKS